MHFFAILRKVGANEAARPSELLAEGQLKDSLATLASLVGGEKIEICVSHSDFCRLFSKKSFFAHFF
jgi:hypothetical protein